MLVTVKLELPGFILIYIVCLTVALTGGIIGVLAIVNGGLSPLDFGSDDQPWLLTGDRNPLLYYGASGSLALGWLAACFSLVALPLNFRTFVKGNPTRPKNFGRVSIWRWGALFAVGVIFFAAAALHLATKVYGALTYGLIVSGGFGRRSGPTRLLSMDDSPAQFWLSLASQSALSLFGGLLILLLFYVFLRDRADGW